MKKQRKVEKDNRGVAIYARKSRITNKGDSIGVQFKQCADYAKKELGLDEEYEFLQYEDKGLSGYFSDRPDFQRIPPKYSVSQVMGYLKGKSSLMIFDRHANLKYKYGNRHFWARGYYVDTVGRNKKQIQEYIRNQLQEDQIADQISIKEFVDPFTGSVNKKA